MDIIKKYKNHNLLKNIWIIVTSLFFAILINYSINNTSISNSIKSSVMNSKYIQNVNSDIYIKKENNTIKNILNITNSKNINGLKSLNLTIVYNPNNLELKNTYTTINNIKPIIINKENWLLTISLDAQEINIKENSSLINILFEKRENKIEHVNIINAFFTDKDNNTFELSTSWIDF